MPAISLTNSDSGQPWQTGMQLQLKVAGIFPCAKPEAADLSQPFRPQHLNLPHYIKLWPPERVQLIRPLDGGRFLLCHHASGPFFIAKPERFSPITP